MTDQSQNSTGKKRGRKSRWKGSLSDFLLAWEKHKEAKEADMFVSSKEVKTGAAGGTTTKYSQRPYSINGFANELGYSRWEHMKVEMLKKGEGYAEACDLIETEFAERLDLLAMTGAINPIYTARIRRLCDKQVVEHEGEITTRSAEKPCSAEEAAAHFASWNAQI